METLITLVLLVAAGFILTALQDLSGLFVNKNADQTKTLEENTLLVRASLKFNNIAAQTISYIKLAVLVVVGVGLIQIAVWLH